MLRWRRHLLGEAGGDAGSRHPATGQDLAAVALGALVATALVAFDSLGLTTAMPRIAADLGGQSTYGWSLAALTLATVLGTTFGAILVERRGLPLPCLVGFTVFAAGVVVSAATGSWAGFLLGRAVQGLGGGTMTTVVTVAVVRGFPPALRARGFALISSAWALPALLGPTAAGLVTDLFGWRALLVVLLGLTVPAAVIAVSAVRRVEAAARREAPSLGLGARAGARAAAVALGAALIIAGLDQPRTALGGVMAAAGAVAAALAVRTLIPTGTLRVRRGPPAGVALRGVLCLGYFSADTYLPLGLVAGRGASALEAGLVVGAGSLGWAAGAGLQARAERRTSTTRARQLRVGVALLGAGMVVVLAGMLVGTLPLAVTVAGWALAGAGMGQSYNAATTETFARSAAADDSTIAAGLQLVQTLAIALGAGGGTALVTGLGRYGATSGVAVVLGAALLCVVAAVPIAIRATASSDASSGASEREASTLSSGYQGATRDQADTASPRRTVSDPDRTGATSRRRRATTPRWRPSSTRSPPGPSRRWPSWGAATPYRPRAEGAGPLRTSSGSPTASPLQATTDSSTPAQASAAPSLGSANTWATPGRGRACSSSRWPTPSRRHDASSGSPRPSPKANTYRWPTALSTPPGRSACCARRRTSRASYGNCTAY